MNFVSSFGETSHFNSAGFVLESDGLLLESPASKEHKLESVVFSKKLVIAENINLSGGEEQKY